jgi:hypothetical protein
VRAVHRLLRYTLDLFAATPPLADLPLPAALADVADPSLPSAFSHPQAKRQAVCEGMPVRYAFTRSQRRTIGFQVGPQGLSVRAPLRTPLYVVDAAVQEKAAWIVRKLREVATRPHPQHPQAMRWADGMELPYLGRSIMLRMDRRHPRSAAPTWDAAGDTLWLPLGADATPAQLQRAMQRWMQEQALVLFGQRLAHFAPLLGVRWSSLRLSNARTRWGSAKSDGTVRLHWRLLQFRPEVIDYVVAHELSHLRVMDHSPDFWATVESVVPSYAALRRELKQERLPTW